MHKKSLFFGILFSLLTLSSFATVYGNTITWQYPTDIPVSTANTDSQKDEAVVQSSPLDSTKLVSAYNEAAVGKCRVSTSSDLGADWTVPSGSYPPVRSGDAASGDPVLSPTKD